MKGSARQRLDEARERSMDRMTLLSALELDQRMAERAEPRLPEISFIKRELPGERQWPKQRLERKNLE